MIEYNIEFKFTVELKLNFYSLYLQRIITAFPFKQYPQAGTGLNSQHLRFVLIHRKDSLKLLAEANTSVTWITGASFAVMVLASASFRFKMLDAGRALQSMQLASWAEGVGSDLFTGIREVKIRNDSNIPNELIIAVTAGFGFPKTYWKTKETHFSEQYHVSSTIRKPLD